MNKKHQSKLEDKVMLSPEGKKYKEDLEREWESILLKDKKKVVEKYSAFDEYLEQEAFESGTVSGYESAKTDFKIINRITWVLTAVNVGILISLVIKKEYLLA